MTDRQQIAADCGARGFGCDLWPDPTGQRRGDFTHASSEVEIVLEGEMEVGVEGEIDHPQLGEELFVPAGAVHSARNIGSKETRWLYGYGGGA